MKKSKQLGIRITAEEYARLERVQADIALNSRGQKPEISEILRAVIGWGNKMLVSPAERAFIAGIEYSPNDKSDATNWEPCGERAPLLQQLDAILHADTQMAEWIRGNIVTFTRALNSNGPTQDGPYVFSPILPMSRKKIKKLR